MARASIQLAVFVACALLGAAGGGAQTIDLVRLRTLHFDLPAQRVIAVQDMDGDGLLDVVLIRSDPTILWVAEEVGDELVVRFTVTDVGLWRSAVVSDTDRDGLPEILTGHRSDAKVRIWESTGNDTYGLKYTRPIGRFIEQTVAGDSDGDGLLEFLVPRESSPTRLFVLEAVADDTFVEDATLTGAGGNMTLAGVGDLDGDSRPELVFSDDQYSSIERVWVFEDRSLVFTDPGARLEVASLGDTDGDGLGEILGFDSITRFGPVASRRLRILESTGVGDGFVQVFDDLARDYSPVVLDVDGDRWNEMWRSLEDAEGHRTIFTLAHRSGSTLIDVYNSGGLLHGFEGDIVGILNVENPYGDGPLTVVHQGNQIHLLAQGQAASVEIPALTATGLLLLVAVLGLSGLTLLGRKRSGPSRSRGA